MLSQSHPLGSPWTDVFARLEDERIMLQRIAAGEPLVPVLEHVLRAVEAQSSVPLRTSILFVDEQSRLRVGAAPNLPADYLAQIDGTVMGPRVASWGLAAYSGEPVYIPDIASHSNWDSWREYPNALGLKACWSSPIKRPDGLLLGVFSNYYTEYRLPTPQDIEAIALVTRTAALAIERHRTEQALSLSAQRWRSMFEGMREGFVLAQAVRDPAGHIQDFRLLESNPAFEQQCGRQSGTSLGLTLTEMLRHAPAQLMDTLIQVVMSGESAHTEYCVPAQPPIWYEVRARREGMDRLAVMLLDVSARKAAERELWDEQRHKSFQLALGDRLRLLDQPEQIERTVCEALGRYLGLREVALLRLAPRSTEVIKTAGWQAVGAASPLSRPIRSAVRKAIGTERSQPLAADAMASGLIVPLGRWGRPDSALIVRTTTQIWLQPADQACVEEVAERLCDALERSTHAMQLQERVEQAIAERDRIWRLSPEVLAVMDSHGQFLSASPAVRSILGWTPEQFVTMGFSVLLHPDDRQATRTMLARALGSEGKGMHYMENRLRKRDGDYGYITWTLSAARGHLYLAGRDDTHLQAQAEALREAENALRQAQKMEAVGRLTGGIAHDFNNMLQGMSGALYLLQRRLTEGNLDAARRYVGMASDACERAGQLTQRLLTFSRRQPIDPKPGDATDMLRSMVDLFRHYTGERVTLDFELQPGTWTICCDASQFESVLLNLVINACDAMPEGGQITISTSNVELDNHQLQRFPEALPGEFVEVAITDTGRGMAPEVLAQAFEPFFTTKPPGAGTGLGLSTSYGFAQQAGGALTIQSAPGEGTTVRLWLPRHCGHWHVEEHRFAAASPTGNTRPQSLVLLVEDDDTVREMVIEAIASPEITVIWARDGMEGAQLLADTPHVDLLLTDIGLPGMDGSQLARKAREQHPDLPVLFMTGYAESAAKNPSFLGHRMELIVKPFSLDTLAARVQAMLGATLRPAPRLEQR